MLQIETLSHKAQTVLANARAKGLKVDRAGKGWRIHGPHVDVLVDDLKNTAARDLEPARGAGSDRPTGQ